MAKATRRLKRNQEKHIAETEEHDEFQKTLDVVKKWILPILIVGILIAIIFSVFERVKGSSYKETDRISGLLRSEQSPEKILELVDEHAEAPEAANQLMRAAKLRYDDGNYQGAIEAYDKVIKGYAGYPFALEAQYNIYQCQENNGDLDDAIEGYKTFLADNPDNYRAPLAEIAIARCMLQTEPPQLEKAKELFDSFVKENPTSPFKAIAEDYAEHTERLVRNASGN